MEDYVDIKHGESSVPVDGMDPAGSETGVDSHQRISREEMGPKRDEGIRWSILPIIPLTLIPLI